MRVKSIILFCCIVLLFGCKNTLLPNPDISNSNSSNNNTSGDAWGSPQNLVVSQGLKGEVTISWNPVKGADMYYVFSQDTPAAAAIQRENSVQTECVIKEKAGALKYYTVIAVKKSGEKSLPSSYVYGTTLAKPQITSITPKDGEETSTVHINWWMSNLTAEMETYGSEVHYKIYVKEEKTGTELPSVESQTNSTTISGLRAKTAYLFKITAWNTVAQEKYEESEWMNQETARRLKPQPPDNLAASKGLYADKTVLTWNIPQELVEYPSGDGSYTPLQLFFKIYRRVQGDTEWLLLDTYKIKTEEYIPGGETSWTDGSADKPQERPKSGVQYEYKVQSFADSGKTEISSDDSAAETTGWLVKSAVYSVHSVSNKEKRIVTVSFSALWDNFGFEEELYSLVIKNERAHISDQNMSAWETISSTPLTLAALFSYKKELHFNADEGYNRFVIELCYGSEVKQTYVSPPITVTEKYFPSAPCLTKEEGWTDRIRLTWTFDPLVTLYELTVSNTEDGDIQNVDISSMTQSDDGTLCVFEHTALEAGKNYYYRLRACGDAIYSDIVFIKASTLGIPSPLFNDFVLDYNSITVSWESSLLAELPDTTIPYEVSYIYDGETRSYAVDLASDATQFSISADKMCTLTFIPELVSNAAYGGKPLSVSVKAKSSEMTSPAGLVDARTMGPALTGLSATKALFSDKIELTWNEIAGASGYIINRKDVVSGKTDIYYYYAKSNAETVRLEINPDPVNLLIDSVAVQKKDGVYTLIDKYKKDILIPNESAKEYYSRQSSMPWGNTYVYTIVPLKGDDTELPGTLAYTNENIQTGYVLGYGLDVQASKAHDKSSVTINWKEPPLPSDVSATYNIYRRSKNNPTWNLAASGIDKTTYNNILKENIPNGYDFTAEAWEYIVGVSVKQSVSSNPIDDTLYQAAIPADPVSGEKNNVGYTLNPPVIQTLSRGEDAQLNALFQEKITWMPPSLYIGSQLKYSPGIDGYEIEILNNNISSDRITVKDVPAQANNESYVQIFGKDDSGIIYKNDGTSSEVSAVLKVLRDYKHNYRIRSYNKDAEGNKVYSDYSNEMWGARQITNLEFTQMSLIAMSVGMSKVRGTIGSISDGNSSYPNLSSSSSFVWGPSDYKISVTYSSWQSMLKPLSSKDEVESVVIDGTLMARGGTAEEYQKRYWTDKPIEIKYLDKDGTFSVEGDGGSKTSGSTTRTSGSITTSWNGETVKYDMSLSPRPFNIPFAFPGGYLNDTEEWK